MARAERLAALSTVADRVERARPVTLAREQTLPVLPALAPLLPLGALRRGATVSVDGAGAATSLALALAAGASDAGSWVAAVGFPSLGLAAAAELGLALERFVLVAEPDEDVWGSVTAALVDAFDVVLVRTSRRVRAADARRLAARGRERGAVLVPVSSAWPEGADVALRVTACDWRGLGDGHGHLRARRVVVEAGGRRDAARPRRAELWLPGPEGGVEAVLPAPVPFRRHDPPSFPTTSQVV